MNNGSNLNLYEVTTNRLQRVKAGRFVFSVWRGKTSYKDDVIKCFIVDDDDSYENRFDLINVQPLWIEKKNLKHVRPLSNEEIKQLNDNNLLQYENADDIFIYGKFIKESEKALLVKFANEIDVWIAKSLIVGNRVYGLKGREDICFEFPRWLVKDKLGQAVTNKFANAKDLISQRLSTLTTKFNLGGLNV
tara:strand:+ start:3749 stop:4321 length:573 start_codon:yes stop_codon:yes gene_type:complete